MSSALIAAITTLVVFAGAQLLTYLFTQKEHKRQTQIQYLYPLKIACDDLFERWQRLWKTCEDMGPAAKTATLPIYMRARDGVGNPEFYRLCNDELCEVVGTLYATACYFAFARKLREQLPLVRIRQDRALSLLNRTDAVRVGLGGTGCGGLWSEIQDSIGQLVTTESGHVISYREFCFTLSKDRDSYFRLFNFYIDLPRKLEFEFKAARDALKALREELVRILRIEQSSLTGMEKGTHSEPAVESARLQPVLR